MTAVVNEIDLVLRNDVSEISRFDATLDQLQADDVLNEKIVHSIRLCGHEVLANSMSYAFDAKDKAAITIQLRFSSEVVEMEVADNGRPFDPLQVDDHVTPASLEDAKIGGLGLVLIKAFCDNVQYRHDGEFNRLTMNFARNN